MRKILIRISIVILVMAVVFSGILAFGLSYMKKHIDYSMDEELFLHAKKDQTIYYYALNKQGKLTEVYKSSGIAKKEWTDFLDAGKYIKLGFIAMEDRDFYEHNGVNYKRTFLAMLNQVFKFKASFGASTITQQVIKNISGDNDISISRKINEIFRAFNLEKNHSKDDIFELYLNIIPMSGNIYGVGAAAEIYFGREPDELSLAEAATLVGITNAPSKYNPYLYPKECIEKRNKVLYAMHECEYISDEEYEEGIRTPLILKSGMGNFGVSSWFIETANDEIFTDVELSYGLSRGAARILLNGARVVLTMDPEIQTIMEEYFENTDNLSPKYNDGLKYSMVVSDPYSGNLLGIIGNGGKKNSERLFNYATSPVTPGSVLKPLALYAPLIDNGVISYSSMFDDAPLEYIGEGENRIPYPKNAPDVYEGMIDVSYALKKSKNTVAVHLYNILGMDQTFSHLKEKYNFNTLVDKKVTADGRTLTDKGTSPLALGQLTDGISLRKLTEAYGVFPNDGALCEGKSYLAVYDTTGKVIIKKDTKEKGLYTKEGARIMTALLSEVVKDGTARQIKLKELVDVAGKTGTSGNDLDRLFVGYTPYYVAGIWSGFSMGGRPVGANSPNHIRIWDEVMQEIHKRKVFCGYDEDIKGFKTDGLIYVPYCKKSGLIPHEGCELDEDGEILYGYFTEETLPIKECDYH